MENCLVTKLKGVVNNSNLEELGVIKLPLLNSNGDKAIILRLGGYSQEKPVSVTIGNGTLYTYGNDTPLPVPAILVGAGAARQYIANSDTVLKIADKYNLAAMDLSKYSYKGATLISANKFPESYIVDFNEYKYCKYLSYFTVTTDDTIGSIDECFGNIESAPSTFKIAIKTGNGDIVNLVKKWVSNGITSGNINNNFQISHILSTVYDGYNIYFNGTILNMPIAGSLVWNNTKIYATWGSSVYCVGYTDGEISTNTASGGIWEGKTVTKCD